MKKRYYLRNPCSELVSGIVKYQENFPRKELHASNTVNTPDTEGAEVSPEHGRVLWGGNRLALTPQSPLPAKTGYRNSWRGGHLVTTISH